MSTAAIVKACVILMGIGIMIVTFGVYQMTIQISSLLMKNQELAILVSLLNQENERILRELEKLTGKNAREL